MTDDIEQKIKDIAEEVKQAQERCNAEFKICNKNANELFLIKVEILRLSQILISVLNNDIQENKKQAHLNTLNKIISTDVKLTDLL